MNAGITTISRAKASPGFEGVDAQHLLDAMSSAAVVFAQSGEILAANRRAEHLLAAPVASVIGQGADGAFRLFRERAGQIRPALRCAVVPR
jgi:nitrogen fixation/metabolism regulation signal transduction histidine kinase